MQIILTAVTAGLLTLTPATGTSTPPAPTTGPPVDHMQVTLKPDRGVPGTRVMAELDPCGGLPRSDSEAVDLGFTGSSGEASGTVKDVKPGRYLVTVYCTYANTPHYGVGSAYFTVLGPAPSPQPTPAKPTPKPSPGKQVKKVPVGAAQTGDGSALSLG